MSDAHPDSLRARWSDCGTRRDLVAFMARDLSKTGRLAGYDAELRGLSEFLSPEEATSLYVTLRDDSRRLEFEWRAEFLSYFPAAAALLPEAEVDEKDFRQSLASGQLRFVTPVPPRTRRS